MSRTLSLVYIVVVTFLGMGAVALVVSSAGAQVDSPVPTAVKPNIVFILADDMREEDLKNMPKTKAIFADGVSFKNYYTTFPLCCPSRTSILTGLYVHNHHVVDSSPPNGGFRKFMSEGLEPTTVAVALQNAGYTTGLVGKYLNGYQHGKYVPTGWDEWQGKVSDHNTPGEEYYDYKMSNNGHPVHYGHHAKDYETDVNSKLSSDFITASAPSDKPFFLYSSPSAPHGPLTPAPRDKHTAECHNAGDRCRAVQVLDDLVENLYNTVAASGELENTYFFFTSDNGFMHNEHGIDKGKRASWEQSSSVQLLVKGPGVTPGEKEEPSGNIDLAPTFAELGGATLPAPYDGRSLLPVLTIGDSPRNKILIENPLKERGPYTGVVVQLDSGTYKYVKKGGAERNLYNLTTDPGEHHDLWGAASADFKTQLEGYRTALANCYADSCREADSST